RLELGLQLVRLAERRDVVAAEHAVRAAAARRTVRALALDRRHVAVHAADPRLRKGRELPLVDGVVLVVTGGADRGRTQLRLAGRPAVGVRTRRREVLGPDHVVVGAVAREAIDAVLAMGDPFDDALELPDAVLEDRRGRVTRDAVELAEVVALVAREHERVG